MSEHIPSQGEAPSQRQVEGQRVIVVFNDGDLGNTWGTRKRGDEKRVFEIGGKPPRYIDTATDPGVGALISLNSEEFCGAVRYIHDLSQARFSTMDREQLTELEKDYERIICAARQRAITPDEADVVWGAFEESIHRETRELMAPSSRPARSSHGSTIETLLVPSGAI